MEKNNNQLVNQGYGERIWNRLLHPVAEVNLRDILQVIIGASILAIPVGFTEETWHLGEALPIINVIGLMLLSFLFISAFVYYHYYRGRFREHWDEFLKRVLSTYLFSFLVVAVLLGLIQRTPWQTNWILAFKRIIIVTFPASMSGIIADTLK